MGNLKEAILLSIITVSQRFFTWDRHLEQVLAMIAFTAVWWCILTWKDEVISRFKATIKKS